MSGSRGRTPAFTKPMRIPRGAGGWSFAPNPELGATETLVFWQPEVLPTAIVLGEAQWAPAKRQLGPALLMRAVATYHAADGFHLILPNEVRVTLLGPDPTLPMAVIIPPDETNTARLASVERLRRTVSGKPAGPLPPSQRLTQRQRRRLIQMLMALDGRLSVATYREIAAVIFGSQAAHEKGWKTTPVRGQTIRLVRDGFRMMNGDYLKLLRGR